MFLILFLCTTTTTTATTTTTTTATTTTTTTTTYFPPFFFPHHLPSLDVKTRFLSLIKLRNPAEILAEGILAEDRTVVVVVAAAAADRDLEFHHPVAAVVGIHIAVGIHHYQS